jgi:hypothetical protein
MNGAQLRQARPRLSHLKQSGRHDLDGGASVREGGSNELTAE